MDLPEFLLARITEEQSFARRLLGVIAEDETIDGVDWRLDAGVDWRLDAGDEYPSVIAHPTRVLAECEAKRRIVESCRVDYEDAQTSGDDGDALAEEVLWALALPYADHPDYDEAWRP